MFLCFFVQLNVLYIFCLRYIFNQRNLHRTDALWIKKYNKKYLYSKSNFALNIDILIIININALIINKCKIIVLCMHIYHSYFTIKFYQHICITFYKYLLCVILCLISFICKFFTNHVSHPWMLIYSIPMAKMQKYMTKIQRFKIFVSIIYFKHSK